jgi:hypothetical protein
LRSAFRRIAYILSFSLAHPLVEHVPNDFPRSFGLNSLISCIGNRVYILELLLQFRDGWDLRGTGPTLILRLIIDIGLLGNRTPLRQEDQFQLGIVVGFSSGKQFEAHCGRLWSGDIWSTLGSEPRLLKAQ